MKTCKLAINQYIICDTVSVVLLPSEKHSLRIHYNMHIYTQQVHIIRTSDGTSNQL